MCLTVSFALPCRLSWDRVQCWSILALGQALPSAYERAGSGVGGGVAGEDGLEAAVLAERADDRLGGVLLAAVGELTGAVPDRAHDVVAVAAAEVLEERPVAVLVEALRVVDVQRGRRPADLAVGEVLTVVVDPVGEALLHPGGGRLHQPRVLLVVVRELDRVEELVGGGHPEAVDGLGAAVLRGGEVVVEHAVARGLARVPGLDVLRGAVAVEVVGADVLEVDVELAAAAVVAVLDRPAVVQRADLLAPHLVHGRERRVHPRLARRCVGGRRHPVDAEVAHALALGGDGVAVAVGVVRPVGRAGEHPACLGALGGGEGGVRREQVTHRERALDPGVGRRAGGSGEHRAGAVQGLAGLLLRERGGGRPRRRRAPVRGGRGTRGHHGECRGHGHHDGGDRTTHVFPLIRVSGRPRVHRRWHAAGVPRPGPSLDRAADGSGPRLRRGQLVAEIFSMSAVVEMAGVRGR